MDWELSKENIQPLKRGRDVKALIEATPQRLEEQRKGLWKAIEEYKGDDPLEVWIRLIEWTQQAFPHGHQEEMLKLTEQCFTEFKEVEAYKSDSKFLRVCLLYADNVRDPSDLFSFMKENSICLDLAGYYEAYATFLELRGNFAKAETILQSGIDRLANPVDRLKKRLQDFQQRKAARHERKVKDIAELGYDPSAAEEVKVRPALNMLHAKGTMHNPRPSARRPSAFTAPTAMPSAMPRPGAKPAPNSSKGADLEIFVDDEFRPGGVPSSSGPGESAPGLGKWRSLSTAEQMRRENVQKPAKWAGQRVPQVLDKAPAVELEILVDEEFANQPTPTKSSTAPKGTLRQKLDAGPVHSLLEGGLSGGAQDDEQRPLALGKKEVLERSSAHVTSKGAPTAKRCREPKERLEWFSHLGGDEDPVSYEELRAQHWFSGKALEAAASVVNSALECSAASGPDRSGSLGIPSTSAPSQATAGCLTGSNSSADLQLENGVSSVGLPAPANEAAGGVSEGFGPAIGQRPASLTELAAMHIEEDPDPEPAAVAPGRSAGAPSLAVGKDGGLLSEPPADGSVARACSAAVNTERFNKPLSPASCAGLGMPSRPAAVSPVRPRMRLSPAVCAGRGSASEPAGVSPECSDLPLSPAASGGQGMLSGLAAVSPERPSMPLSPAASSGLGMASGPAGVTPERSDLSMCPAAFAGRGMPTGPAGVSPERSNLPFGSAASEEGGMPSQPSAENIVAVQAEPIAASPEHPAGVLAAGDGWGLSSVPLVDANVGVEEAAVGPNRSAGLLSPATSEGGAEEPLLSMPASSVPSADENAVARARLAVPAPFSKPRVALGRRDSLLPAYVSPEPPTSCEEDMMAASPQALYDPLAAFDEDGCVPVDETCTVPRYMQRPGASEPTVTFATEESYGVLNNMFCGPLPSENLKRLDSAVKGAEAGRRPAPSASRRSVGSALRPPVRATRPSMGTGWLPALGGLSDRTAPLPPRARRSSAATAMLPRASSLADPTQRICEGSDANFAVYEDTGLLGPAGGAFSAGGGLDVYQDTALLGAGHRDDAALQVYEDTEFINAGPMEAETLEVYADTQFLTGRIIKEATES